MSVAGVLLAAGAGRRMGGPKALVEFDGEPLVRRGVRLLADAGCDPVLVVMGAAAGEVAPLCDGADVVVAAGWATGMGASLRAGLEALAGSAATSAVVVLVDQPLVTAEAVQRLVAASVRGAVAAVATYDGRQRNPVLLDRSVWPGVAEAAVGDAGARHWLRSHPELVVEVDCTGSGSPDDVDTPEDLARLEHARLEHAHPEHARTEQRPLRTALPQQGPR